MEIWEILSNSSLALIGIDIAIYAISVTLLGSQLKLNLSYIKRRLAETQNEIKELSTGLDSTGDKLSKVEEKIKGFKEEEAELENRLYCLTLWGAVIRPTIFFFTVLLLTTVNSFFPFENAMVFQLPLSFIVVFGSVGLLLVGVYYLFCTLISIDYAATATPFPDFDVFFESNDEKKIKINLSEKSVLNIGIANEGYEMGEIIDISLFFPPPFKVYRSPEYDVVVQPETSSLPKYTAVFAEFEYMHIETYLTIEVKIRAPEKGIFKIPVYVNEKRITQQEFELELEVE